MKFHRGTPPPLPKRFPELALGNYGHLSYEKQQELLRELGDIEVGVGTLVSTNARMAQAVKSSVDQLRKWVKQQPHVYVDESP